MDKSKLKGARVQILSAALFYAVLPTYSSIYMLCQFRDNMETLCTLALLPPWVQTWFKPESKRPVFRPCWPAVAVLGSGGVGNRSPPGERPCRATQGRFCANRCGGAVQVSFFSAQSCKLKGKPSSLRRPTKNLPLGGGASRALVRRCRTAH